MGKKDRKFAFYEDLKLGIFASRVIGLIVH